MQSSVTSIHINDWSCAKPDPQLKNNGEDF